MHEVTYNTIGKGYNKARCADPHLADRLYELMDGDKGNRYLDIGCGTGNYTSVLSERGLQMIGVDPSDMMLKEAYKKGTNVLWVKGQAESLPFDDNYFHGIFGTLTLHHWNDLSQGFCEMNRVLKSNGKAVFFVAPPDQTNGYWLKHYFPEIIRKSVEVLPSTEILQSTAANAGFRLIGTEKYFVKEDLQDHFFFVGKHNPELYFDENIRAGISSFAALANKEEVEEGLIELRQDIDSGKFNDVKSKYDNDLGDYLFMVWEK